MMMSCSCRTAALRLFVRNITSTQIPADLTARQAARYQTLSSSLSRGFTNYNGTSATALRQFPQARTLHTSVARSISADQATKEENTGVGQDEPPREPSVSEPVETGDTSRNPVSGSGQDVPPIPARKQRKIRRMAEKNRLKMEAKLRAAPAKVDPPPKATGPKTKHAKRGKQAGIAKKTEKTEKTEKLEKAEEKTEEELIKERKAVNRERREQKKKDEAAAKLKDIKAKEKAWNSLKEPWQAQKEALKEKFPEGWRPRKKLSPDAMAGVRALHKQFPDIYTTEALGKHFEVSPEAIRRILKSKWEEKDESPDIDVKRQERWFKRGKTVWTHWAELGKKPPQKWRAEGIVRHPMWNIPRGPVQPQHLKKKQKSEARREARERRLAVERLSGSLM